MCAPGRFIECIVAPGFEPEAFEILTTKPTWKNSVRLLDLGAPIGPEHARCRRASTSVGSRGACSSRTATPIEDDPIRRPGRRRSGRRPTTSGPRWNSPGGSAQAVKSNAIVLAQGRQLVGVGAGQMSRLDSVKIAVEKAGDRAQGAVLASDAFFPFRDGPDAAAAAGVTAIIQPGGSRRDDETLAACNEHGMAMILTGRRHFRH